MNGKLKLIAGIGAAVLFGCGALTMCTSNMAQSSQDVLDSASLYKAMGVLDHQVSVIDNLVSVLTIQNVVIAAVVLVVLLICVTLVRGTGTKNNGNQPIIIQGGYQQPQISAGPHYLSLGAGMPSLPYLLSLPDYQKLEVLDQLQHYERELQMSLGQQPLLAAGKKGRWG